ncbi:YveK family protein [Clostridium cuniculi]|uniref:YveK family protein n=1 Tax=Clostridium cuniculi TaxID=2548455 RepID=UPI001055B916|nr:Wzz/FepE/Etk N-terminal domain-containing protein [Clostridium cuniculi]
MEKEVVVDKFIDKIEIIYCIRKRWKMILILICIVMSCVFGVNKFASRELMYQSKTTIFIGKEEAKSEGKSYQNSDVLLYQSLVKSYEYIYKTPDMINSAVKDKVDVSVETIQKNLKVSALEDTQILQITYNDTNPNNAKMVLELLNSKFIDKVNYLVPNSNVDVIEAPQKPLVAINSEERIPSIIAVLFAVVISTGVALVVERWNDYILTEEELESLVAKPILSVVPKIDIEKGE